MSSWNTLTEEQQRQFARNCTKRRHAYELWTRQKGLIGTKDILIVGDRPGPKAPQRNGYHHTPFYSKLYSGGWLNAELVLAGIPEDRLMWINAYTWDNQPESGEILTAGRWSHVIALGNNAAQWLTKNGCTGFTKVLHPQAQKRFHSKEPYPLIEHLLNLLYVPE